MKKLLFIIILLSFYSFAQENRIVRQQELSDSLDAVRLLIGTGGVPLPDSIIYTSETANFVDKTTSQTITGQKNFSGTVKIGSDTSMSLGVLDGGVRTGLTITQLAGHPYGHNRVFKSIPLDSYTSSWTLKTGVTDFAPTVDGVDHAINLSYNGDGEITTGQGAAQFGFQLEANYEWDDTSTIYEWFSYYNDYPSPLTSYSIRPFQMGIYRGQSGLWNKRTIALDVDELWVGKTGGTSTSDAFKFNAGETLGLWKNSLWLQDSSSLCNVANNFGWLYQRDTSGSIVEIARVDNYNNVQIGKDYATGIRLSAPVLFDSKSAPDRIGNQVSLYNDDGILKAIDGFGNTKTLTGKALIPTDTTGLEINDMYADPLSGKVSVILPENLILNGDFTDWTGTGKSAVPDNWEYSDPRDTTAYYVEQSPVGKLHYVTDGETGGTLASTVDSETGVLYGYSFTIESIDDSALIYIAGNGNYYTTAGYYHGEVESASDGSLFSISPYNTIPTYSTNEITIDNVVMWKVTGGTHKTVVDGDAWSVFYTDGNGAKVDLGIGASGTVLKSNGTSSAPSWQSDATGAGGSAYTDSLVINGRRVPGDSIYTIDEVDAIVISYVDSNYVLTSETVNWDKNGSNDLITTTNFSGDVTGNYNSMAVADDSHNHIISNVDGLQTALDAKQDAVSSFDTLAFSFNIPDTVIAGDNAIWKIPNNITIVEVSAFTNTGTVTFNIEERGETTPNTAGTDVMTSDLVADTDQQETTTFSNSTLDKNDWVALVVASKTGDPTLFGVTIYYVKTN